MSVPSTDPRVQAQKRVGQTLNNKWTIDRLIDMGGMASVYAATHRNGKKVAIKMLHPHIAAHEDVRERFLREGYVANQVDHPGAVSVLDDDITAGRRAVPRHGAARGRLARRLDAQGRRRAPLPDVLAIADQVLDVLAARSTRATSSIATSSRATSSSRSPGS